MNDTLTNYKVKLSRRNQAQRDGADADNFHFQCQVQMD